jgi:hypothetical protein
MCTQAVNAQENIPGRWHFQEDRESKSCVLIGEGLKSAFGIVARPNQLMMSLSLQQSRRPADRDDGPGTITVASTNTLRGLLNRFEQVTVPFVRSSQEGHLAAAYIGHVSRSELQKVLALVKTASDDADGALMFRFGNLEERFLAGRGMSQVILMQACVDKL